MWRATRYVESAEEMHQRADPRGIRMRGDQARHHSDHNHPLILTDDDVAGVKGVADV